MAFSTELDRHVHSRLSDQINLYTHIRIVQVDNGKLYVTVHLGDITCGLQSRDGTFHRVPISTRSGNCVHQEVLGGLKVQLVAVNRLRLSEFGNRFIISS